MIVRVGLSEATTTPSMPVPRGDFWNSARPAGTAKLPALVANAREVEVDAAQAAQIEEDIRREQREFVGDERAERLFVETRKFVASNARLQAAMSTPGIGLQPSAKKAVEALLEHVRKLKHI